MNSIHSFIYYNNWTLNKTKYLWKFKWDADFIASDKLIEYLNIFNYENDIPTVIIMNSKNSDSDNKESYLTNCPFYYTKYIFWETFMYTSTYNIIELSNDIYIEHASLLCDLKSYWKNTPWFFLSNDEEAINVRNRYIKLVNDFGPEPIGMARASNPKCDEIYSIISTQNLSYVNFLS